MKQFLSTHATSPALRVDMGQRAYTCRPFAMPWLLRPSMVAALSTNGGDVRGRHGLHEWGQVLHHEAGMCTVHQALYVFPRLIDAKTLGCLVAPSAPQLVTEAMVHDYWRVFDGGPSQLAPMIPSGGFSNPAVAFALGVVFTDREGVTPPHLPDSQKWLNSTARARLASLMAQPWTIDVFPSPPAPLLDSLLLGFEACVRAADRDELGSPWMCLQDTRAVVHMGHESHGPRLSLPIDALSEPAWTDLLTHLDMLALERLAEPST